MERRVVKFSRYSNLKNPDVSQEAVLESVKPLVFLRAVKKSSAHTEANSRGKPDHQHVPQEKTITAASCVHLNSVDDLLLSRTEKRRASQTIVACDDVKTFFRDLKVRKVFYSWALSENDFAYARAQVACTVYPRA